MLLLVCVRGDFQNPDSPDVCVTNIKSFTSSFLFSMETQVIFCSYILNDEIMVQIFVILAVLHRSV